MINFVLGMSALATCASFGFLLGLAFMAYYFIRDTINYWKAPEINTEKEGENV